MPGFIGFPELLLLGLVALLVFGPKRLPEMGRSLGHGLREFKNSVTGNGTIDGSAELDLTALAAEGITTDTTTATATETVPVGTAARNGAVSEATTTS